MNLSKQAPTERPKDQETSIVDWFLVDFWPRFGKQSIYLLLGVAVVVSVGAWYKKDRVVSQVKENKLLGPAYIYYAENKLDSAEVFLTSFIASGHSRLVQDKANLMLGQIYYSKEKYDESIKAYSLVDLGNTSQPLISSGALHGLASSYMQKKDFTLAAENLEKFVSQFGRKTGKPTEKLEGEEVADLSPVVPNALWKLALSYMELKNTEKAKSTAEKLVKIYPESKEAFDATRFLAQLP